MGAFCWERIPNPDPVHIKPSNWRHSKIFKQKLALRYSKLLFSIPAGPKETVTGSHVMLFSRFFFFNN